MTESNLNQSLISIVIPVYGNPESLASLIERIDTLFKSLDRPHEIILVDDCGPTERWDLLTELSSSRDHITIVQLMRNYGQHNAIMCGLRHALGSYVITMDDDLQNPPEEIPKLINAIETGNYDLVYGVPKRKKHALGRNVGSNLVKLFFRSVFKTSVPITSFRIIRGELVKSILTYNLNFTFIDGLLVWNTERIGKATVEHNSRDNGQSGYSITKLLTLALNLATNFTLLPLQIASCLGLLASVFGLFAGFYFLMQSLLNNIEVQGYSSIIVTVMILGGLQLLALGVIGEYIGRMHLNINRKPQYTERLVVLNRYQKQDENKN